MVTYLPFYQFFKALWTYEPFPWQQMLAERLVEGQWPKALDLPTAAGNTACIDIAIHVLAAQADKPVWERTAPRRIWFVVDRRIVVDEAFERAQTIAEKLRSATDGPIKAIADRLRQISGTERPLAIAKLRGGVFKDDGWARLPSQPAVITSTVDQLGSRLLFRGYGRSALTAPIFAGLAVHDSLILLDEAHLSVPFLQTLRAVARYRGSDWAEQPLRTPFAFSMLSATPPQDIPMKEMFPGADRHVALDHPELKRRICAPKLADLIRVKATKSHEKKDPFIEIAMERAVAFVKRDGRRRVAAIVNRVRTAELIAQLLREQYGSEMEIVLLTGRMRPFERDQLVERWKPVLRANQPDEPEIPLILVTTQCIEVGADFSFDALVTEAASLDALRQRFGRLNRLGRIESTSAAILIRDSEAQDGATDFVYGTAMAECWRLLQGLAETQMKEEGEGSIVDFGIASLDARLQEIDDLAPYLAPAPDAPLLLPSHVDLLCQTSFSPQVEPAVQFFLHGTEREAPEVRVVWRADLDENDTGNWREIVALSPPNSVESVAVPLYRLKQWLSGKPASNDTADVEGGSPKSSPKETGDMGHQANGRIRPLLLWQGREHSLVCKSAVQLNANDVLVIPDAYGMEGLAQSAPWQALGQAQLDIWEPSHAKSGKPAAVRLHREVFKPWLNCLPVRLLIELAEAPAWERESVQEAIDAVLAFKQESEDDEPSLPDWLLSLLRQVRNGRYEQHPTGGLVLRAQKAEWRAEAEQDLFADDDDLLSAAEQEVELDIHSASVERAADKLAGLCLPDYFREPLKVAAYWHDIGKLDDRFQVMLRQGDEISAAAGQPLAKSASVPDSPAQRRIIRSASGLPENFRHEMLSVQLCEHFLPSLDDVDLHDLVLHVISSHHGYGRPFGPISFDPIPPPIRGFHGGVALEAGAEDRAAWPAPHTPDSGVPARFWRLTRRYGWWGLAYLEAILRLSDWYGSHWMISEAQEKSPILPKSLPSTYSSGSSLLLKGIDGSNPLGFLTAVGTLALLHQGGHPKARLAWRRFGLAWCPELSGLPSDDEKVLSEVLVERLHGSAVSAQSEQICREADETFKQKKRDIKEKRNQIKKQGLRGKELRKAIENEVVPFQNEAEVLRKAWLDALRHSVSRPELALAPAQK